MPKCLGSIFTSSTRGSCNLLPIETEQSNTTSYNNDDDDNDDDDDDDDNTNSNDNNDNDNDNSNNLNLQRRPTQLRVSPNRALLHQNGQLPTQIEETPDRNGHERITLSHVLLLQDKGRSQ